MMLFLLFSFILFRLTFNWRITVSFNTQCRPSHISITQLNIFKRMTWCFCFYFACLRVMLQWMHKSANTNIVYYHSSLSRALSLSLCFFIFSCAVGFMLWMAVNFTSMFKQIYHQYNVFVTQRPYSTRNVDANYIFLIVLFVSIVDSGGEFLNEFEMSSFFFL